MTRLIRIGGGATLVALIALAASQAPLGTPLFYALVAVPCVVYALLMHRLFAADEGVDAEPRRLLTLALLLAVAFRIPLASPKVNFDNDMVRYQWDGRVQRYGINPFLVVPADPAVAYTHTDETRRMPSRRARTPYPAAAQLFFRAVVTIWDSSRAMKIALVLCDLLTIWVLVRWLRETGRSEWLALAYAWNPLVILEVAHSGHIDALGALWIAISAWMLSTGRGLRAAVAFVIAVCAKLLPIVLLPLYWKRVSIRDAAVGALVLLLLYLPYADAGTVALGSVPNVIEFIRFNGPVFKFFVWLSSPRGAAIAAVTAGLAVAAWMRVREPAGEPSAWAWPMAVALVGAPVIYPWYLLYFTPFLFTRRTIPLIVWTYSALLAYIVWELSRHGHRWFVPPAIMWIEYGAIVVAMAWMVCRKTTIGTSNEVRGVHLFRRPQREFHEADVGRSAPTARRRSGAGPGAPASDGDGGSGGAKPPGE